MRVNKGFDGRRMTQEEVDHVLDWKKYPGTDGVVANRFEDMDHVISRLWYELKYMRAIWDAV
jgi:hypothetical protein